MLLVRAPMWKSIVLATAVCFLIQGCDIRLWSNVKPVPVGEIDARGISLKLAEKLNRGDPAESVVNVFGEPADRQPSCVPGQVVWRYPIRAWNDLLVDKPQIVPAVLLRLSFDKMDTLTKWHFVDSFSGQSLAVRETLNEASLWFQLLSQAPQPIPPYIELHTVLLQGKTTKLDAERILGQWRPDFYCASGGPAPIVKKAETASGSVWDWYVDRPSPLFVPPHYVIVDLDNSGSLIVWEFQQTYPGGRK